MNPVLADVAAGALSGAVSALTEDGSGVIVTPAAPAPAVLTQQQIEAALAQKAIEKSGAQSFLANIESDIAALESWLTHFGASAPSTPPAPPAA